MERSNNVNDNDNKNDMSKDRKDIEITNDEAGKDESRILEKRNQGVMR